MVASAEWLGADYYRVLGVPETATAKEITAAYRRLARRLHPDAQPDGEDGAAFRDVAAAYAVLHDERERREYDEFRRLTAPDARDCAAAVLLRHPDLLAPVADPHRDSLTALLQVDRAQV